MVGTFMPLLYVLLYLFLFPILTPHKQTWKGTPQRAASLDPACSLGNWAPTRRRCPLTLEGGPTPFTSVNERKRDSSYKPTPHSPTRESSLTRFSFGF